MNILDGNQSMELQVISSIPESHNVGELRAMPSAFSYSKLDGFGDTCPCYSNTGNPPMMFLDVQGAGRLWDVWVVAPGRHCKIHSQNFDTKNISDL